MSNFEIFSKLISSWLIPFIFLFIVLHGVTRKVKVYDAFVEGCKDGLQVAISIIPYLVVILLSIAIFRTSGAMEVLAKNVIGFILPERLVHPDIVLLALIKPLSGSGARGVMLDIFQTHGVDSKLGFMASVIQGSTETTFYVLAVYFGAVNIKNPRHTVACGLIGEFTGVFVSIMLAHAIYKDPRVNQAKAPAAGSSQKPVAAMVADKGSTSTLQVTKPAGK